MTSLYLPEARERFVGEPPKRAGRTAFERDRARIVHSSALRRLSAKTQVLGASVDDFVRNRLTHSLEVAQVARELGKAVGCDPHIVASAALAHDLGHPPFGHNGETALNEAATECGGFEGNAQTLRLLTRLEPKTIDTSGRSVGLNLTRATLEACVKYPWRRGAGPTTGPKFGVYDDDLDVFEWMRRTAHGAGIDEFRRPIEAQVMDVADDIAYSVHDVEDGVVGKWFDLVGSEFGDRAEIYQVARDWYLPEASDSRLEAAWDRLQAIPEWPTKPFDGSRFGLATLKSLTSALIGRFAVAVQNATSSVGGSGPLIRYEADLVLPAETIDEITVLKAFAAHYVMRHDDRTAELADQRALLTGLVEVLSKSGDQHLEPDFRADFEFADSDSARQRIVIDQVAGLTDVSALAWSKRLLD